MPDPPELTVYSSVTARAAILLAHGAGAGQHSPFMQQTARGLAERGITALTFDFPYMSARPRRRAPDRAPVLESSWREAIAAARRRDGSLPLFIGGKSMGGRIASQVGAEGLEGIAGLVFLGYPLHPPGNPQQRRDAHLPRIEQPMLFVQGTRDAFGTVDEIRKLLPRLRHATVHEVHGGDHSFKVSGQKPEVVLMGVLDEVANWIARLTL